MEKKLIFKFLFIFLIIFILFISFFSILKPKAIPAQLNSEDKFDFIIKNLVGGGPQKDGIPSIDNPKYLTANSSNLKDDDEIFGINYKGFIAAYPKNILYWHEIVNENIGGEKISITYCPLTGSVIGYIGYELGVSGKLYNSNLVLYDRKTNSQIPQILGFGIDKKLKSINLKTFNIQITTWKNWKTIYPQTLVLSKDTGFDRDYTKSPYPGYESILQLWFPLTNIDDRLKTKEKVFGIEYNDKQVAIQIKDFKIKYPLGLNLTISGENLLVTYNDSLEILQTNNSKIKSYQVYWFAFSADFPDTKLII